MAQQNMLVQPAVVLLLSQEAKSMVGLLVVAMVHTMMVVNSMVLLTSMWEVRPR